MEFFTCPCPETGVVILDGKEQGNNKDENGDLRTMQCGRGLYRIELRCSCGKQCINSPREVMIEGTNPIIPMEVSFQCEP
jgi:hypothetical protein